MKTSFIVLTILLAIALSNVEAIGKWSTKTAMPTKRSDTTAVLLGNTIIVAGGCDNDQVCGVEFCTCNSISNKVEGFKPDTNQWVTLTPLPTARTRHAAAGSNGKMYVIGGRDLSDTLINTVDVYDSVANTWTTLSNESNWMNATSDLVARIVDGKLYAIGGYDGEYSTPASTSVFDIATSRWITSNVPAMATGRGDACAVAISNSIYVFGGFNQASFCAPLKSLEVYNTITNTWTSKKPMMEARADSACAIVHNELHLIGGEQKNNLTNCAFYDIPINHVESYHPESDSWNEETTIPQVRFRFSGVGYGDNIYIFGGQGSLRNNTYPVTNDVLSWSDDTPTETSSSFKLFSFFIVFIAVLL